MALQFCLAEERIHGNPTGNLNAEQLEANIWAATTPIAADVWRKLQADLGIRVNERAFA
ncbi:MAG: hypothetical protein R2867_41385 [Caldilineaceae bacterium]